MEEPIMLRVSKVSLGLLVAVLLLVLAAPVWAADAKGKIKSVDPDKQEVVITDNDAKNWTFHLDKDAKVFLNDKEAKLADVQPGDAVAITYEKAGDKLMASVIRATKK
jgi:Cu/Ag efflux protein CusF